MESTVGRRSFLALSGAAATVADARPSFAATTATPANAAPLVPVTLRINGATRAATLDVRTTLLDALREELALPGSKKGCDHGQCGACTVLMDGQATLACLTFAIAAQDRDITTIEGLAHGEDLHPMQQAFIDNDAFQCGYCTPGQIMSAVACIKTGHATDDGEIREFMSGNLCRCAAYPNIVAAIKQVA